MVSLSNSIKGGLVALVIGSIGSCSGDNLEKLKPIQEFNYAIYKHPVAYSCSSALGYGTNPTRPISNLIMLSGGATILISIISNRVYKKEK